MRTVAITGGIGSGKSTVCAVFRTLGIPVFEADREGKQLLNTDLKLRNAVTERFGETIYASGTLDRKALAAIVFADPKALAALNELVHPAVRKAFKTWAAVQDAPYVIMEAAILAETGGHTVFDDVILVSAPEAIRIQRTTARDKVNATAVQARMRNQASEEERIAIAHHIIVNDDSQLVIPQVLALHKKLTT